jgi:hypothetical protein
MKSFQNGLHLAFLPLCILSAAAYLCSDPASPETPSVMKIHFIRPNSVAIASTVALALSFVDSGRAKRVHPIANKLPAPNRA